MMRNTSLLFAAVLLCGVRASAQELKSPVTLSIPSKGLVMIEVPTNGKAKGVYVLDNGNVAGTIVSADFIKELGLDPKKQKHQLTLDLGGASVSIGAKIAEAPNNWMSNSLKRKYHCLVGYDFFVQYLVTIDYPGAKLTIAPYPGNADEVKKARPAATEIPFEFVENAALVKTTVECAKGEKMETSFFVDCGMTGNCVDKAHFARLKMPEKKGLTYTPLLTIGDNSWKNVPLVIVDHPAVQGAAKAAKRDVAGLLGRFFLEPYRVTLDYKGKRIFLEK